MYGLNRPAVWRTAGMSSYGLELYATTVLDVQHYSHSFSVLGFLYVRLIILLSRLVRTSAVL